MTPISLKEQLSQLSEEEQATVFTLAVLVQAKVTESIKEVQKEGHKVNTLLLALTMEYLTITLHEAIHRAAVKEDPISNPIIIPKE